MQTGHNKENRHHLRQVGFALALSRGTGLPFYHQVYRGNRQDAQAFFQLVADLLSRLKCG